MTEKTTKKRKPTTRKKKQPAPKRSASKARRFLAPLTAVGRLARRHIFITGAIATGLIVLAVWSLAMTTTAPEMGYEVGNRAPDFNLQTIDGQNVSSSDLRGNVALIGFWSPAEWDSTTDWEKIYLAEQLQRIKQRWADREVMVLAIVPESDQEMAQKVATEKGATFPVALDLSQATAASYGVIYDPTHVFLDEKGIIRAILPGLFQSQYEIEAVLSNIRNKQKVESTRPAISDMQVTMITDKRAEASFATDKPATSWLMIARADANPGDASAFAATPLTEASATTHSITLANLESETTYRFRAFASFNTDGKNPSLSREYTFTTLVDTSPPTISNVKIVDVTDSSLTITWTTDEPATSHAEYPIDQWPNKIEASNDRFTVDHNITLKGLKSGTEYKITLKSKDAAGHESEFVLASVRTLTIPEGSKVGMRAPDLSLPSLDGALVKLSDLRGKIILVNFWLSHCGACHAENPHLQALYDKWPSDKLAMLVVNFREDPQTIRNYMNTNGLTFPVLLDLEGQADALYQPQVFPTTYFINANGIIKQIKQGRFNSLEEIEEIINSIQ
ncbi:MAG: redoxin domain-containing protein [Chloroflexi bacterium]|nr:redoxin domain-containing protein [Chloroflexota bacterium]